jgi:hypothetical protein
MDADPLFVSRLRLLLIKYAAFSSSGIKVYWLKSLNPVTGTCLVEEFRSVSAPRNVPPEVLRTSFLF